VGWDNSGADEVMDWWAREGRQRHRDDQTAKHLARSMSRVEARELGLRYLEWIGGYGASPSRMEFRILGYLFPPSPRTREIRATLARWEKEELKAKRDTERWAVLGPQIQRYSDLDADELAAFYEVTLLRLLVGVDADALSRHYRWDEAKFPHAVFKIKAQVMAKRYTARTYDISVGELMAKLRGEDLFPADWAQWTQRCQIIQRRHDRDVEEFAIWGLKWPNGVD